MASTSRQKRSGNFIHHCVTPRFPKRNLAKKNARRGEVYLDEYSLPSAVHTLHVRHDRDDRWRSQARSPFRNCPCGVLGTGKGRTKRSRPVAFVVGPHWSGKFASIPPSPLFTCAEAEQVLQRSDSSSIFFFYLLSEKVQIRSFCEIAIFSQQVSSSNPEFL